MTWLGDLDRGRDNNFNLIRLLAAIAVLVSHAWPIALGPESDEPLEVMTGYTLGTLAVWIFFAISGYFIAASFVRSRSTFDFLAARALRLFPGLLVSVLVVTLVMGPLVSDLGLRVYVLHHDTWAAIVRNVTLVRPKYTLPGVFEGNPYPAVQGSIWTLIHEVLCYGLVFLAGIAGLLHRRRAMTVAIVVWLALWLLPAIVDLQMPMPVMQTRELSFPFVLGMTFWVWRDRLPLSILGVLATMALATALKGTSLYFGALCLSLTYTTFWVAYVPKGLIRSFNRLGDYSYGMYIYAFPIQGLAVWMFGPLSALENIALSLPLTLLCSVLSWHLVERPALRLR
jgi:peptidoglycan/LPS O-acetylase OafA/YrhL